MKENVVLTLIISLTIQWISLFINFFGLLQPLPAQDFVLKEILGLETVVQAIELGFYTWYKNHIDAKVVDITEFRYYDWMITTPIMLFTTMGFYKYLQQSPLEKEREPLRLLPFFQQNSFVILFILFMNFLMLFFGYLQEIGTITLVSSTLLGFGALFVSFGTLYKEFVMNAPQQFIFFFVFFTWSLYGIAALFDNHMKNTLYNILDLFAKNFYGLYLSYFIYTFSPSSF